MIVGVAGACRCDELTKMVLQDVEDKGNVLVINIPNSKTNKPRYFVVSGEGENNYNINLYRKYLALRPPHTPHQRLFLSYRQGKCSIQPVGIHTFGKIPKMIASYLGLAEPILYTGHCLRRTSATLLVDAGGDLATLKRHGGWRSGTVAEGYIEQSLTNKLEVARKIENRGTDNDGGNSNFTIFLNLRLPKIMIFQLAIEMQPRELTLWCLKLLCLESTFQTLKTLLLI